MNQIFITLYNILILKMKNLIKKHTMVMSEKLIEILNNQKNQYKVFF